MRGVGAYFRPMQFRGPTWNGCRASRLSCAKRGSVPRKRSGWKEKGSAKCLSLW